MPTVKFDKITIDADHKCEAAALVDMTGNGQLDIVCGTHWFQAPNWTKHPLREIAYAGEYFDDFCNLPLDVNGNGRTDIIGCGWFDKSVSWYDNPGDNSAPWKKHVIDTDSNYETAALFDIDADGAPELVPNMPGGCSCFYRLDRDANGKPLGTFTKHVICADKQGHGLGVGDVNGDGRPDLIVRNGWFEAPQNLYDREWVFHEDFDMVSASVPILVYDVNNDGVADIIYGMAHNYGLYWLEQKVKADGSREWIQHEIDKSWSQPHYLALVDLDGDGEPELVTGKRYRAHNGNDPGGNDPCCLYYYKLDRSSCTFERHDIDVGNKVGVGLHLAIGDLTGDGRPDIVCPGKGGLYLMANRGMG